MDGEVDTYIHIPIIEGATGLYQVETRDTVQHPTLPRMAPTTQHYCVSLLWPPKQITTGQKFKIQAWAEMVSPKASSVLSIQRPSLPCVVT